MALRWPEHAVLTGMSAKKEVIFRSRNRMCDLHDSLCRNLQDPLASEYYLAVAIDHPGPKTANDDDFEELVWDEHALQNVESAIHEDFSHDDYVVFLERVTGAGWPQSCTAIWNIAPVEAELD